MQTMERIKAECYSVERHGLTIWIADLYNADSEEILYSSGGQLQPHMAIGRVAEYAQQRRIDFDWQ